MKLRLPLISVILGTIAIALLASGFVYFRWARFEALEEIISRAESRSSSKDAIQALITLAESEEASLKDRNRAVWALGELADRTALTSLMELDRHETCDHATRICVRELKKAIRKLSR